MISKTFEGIIYHTIDWKSHLSARTAESSVSAETSAAEDTVENGIILKGEMDIIIGSGVPLLLCVDSKDLYDSL